MSGPLSGVKVLDFTALLPGPFGTMILSDLGCEMIHIESPARPDPTRLMPPFAGKVSAASSTLQRGKRCLNLNLKVPRSAEVIHELVKEWDVVIEQFRPGVMDRLGVGYDKLREINPRLIYCSITGYGQTGPYKMRAGHDANYLSISGVNSVCGREGEPPVPHALQIADLVGGGCNAVISILAALVHREKTGQGQFLDVAMTDGCWGLSSYLAIPYLADGRIPGQETEFLSGASPYDYYKTKDDRFLSVGSIEPQFWAALCQAIDRKDLERGGIMCMGSDMKAVKKQLAEIIEQKTQAEWIEIFKDIDACVEPVLNMEEAVAHPHNIAREMVVELEGPDGTRGKQIGSPFKFSESKVEFRGAGALQGQHNDEILESLNLDPELLEGLKKQKAFG